MSVEFISAVNVNPGNELNRRYLLPLVRQELAHREATGRRGTLQEEHPGAYAPAERTFV